MKKYFLFIFLFYTSFCSSQEILGNWQFDFILPDTIQIGENLKPISDYDAMQISENGSFHYEIDKLNLIAEGTWELNNNILSLNYSSPKDTSRYYHISVTEESLILNENRINYAFNKSIPSATKGISFNSVFRGALGVFSLLFISFLFSRNRKEIDWKLVGKGLSIQIIFAICCRIQFQICKRCFEFFCQQQNLTEFSFFR